MTPKLEYKRGIYKDTANGNSDKIKGGGHVPFKNSGYMYTYGENIFISNRGKILNHFLQKANWTRERKSDNWGEQTIGNYFFWRVKIEKDWPIWKNAWKENFWGKMHTWNQTIKETDNRQLCLRVKVRRNSTNMEKCMKIGIFWGKCTIWKKGTNEWGMMYFKYRIDITLILQDILLIKWRQLAITGIFLDIFNHCRWSQDTLLIIYNWRKTCLSLLIQ